MVVVHFTNAILWILLLRIFLSFPPSLTQHIETLDPQCVLLPVKFVSSISFLGVNIVDS